MVCQLHPFPSSHPRCIWSSTWGEPTRRVPHSWRPGNSRRKRVLCFTWSPPPSSSPHAIFSPFQLLHRAGISGVTASNVAGMKSCCSDITPFVIYQQHAGRNRHVLIGVGTREALRLSAGVLQHQNCKRKTREKRFDSGGVHQSVNKRSDQR